MYNLATFFEDRKTSNGVIQCQTLTDSKPPRCCFKPSSGKPSRLSAAPDIELMFFLFLVCMHLSLLSCVYQR
uniref:SFRICE_000385 n=1 Tax=Spodoptera frugiperda TaxID=7108 RepID=A0A2H1VHA8_SPOFR